MAPQRLGTRRPMYGAYEFKYDSDGALHWSGARCSHGSSGEEEDHVHYLDPGDPIDCEGPDLWS